MTARPTRRPVNGHTRVAGTIFPPPDAQRRQPARSSARRDPVTRPIEHWNPNYGPTGYEIQRVADTAGFDAAIARVWRMYADGLIDEDTAGEQHDALVEMRDGRPVS